ncbi:MAG TPA: DUF1572 family protein [Symbiobacteriaceae bacterium]|nr:DUF1572 family protein [Symbiobacteriaceae bacterium]
MANEAAAAFLADQRRRFAEIRRRLLGTLSQLSDEQVNWRPGVESNSVSNLVSHICGNLTQRFVAQLGGAPDVRDRAAEFSTDLVRRGEELQWTIDSTFDAVDEVLLKMTEARLLEGIKMRDHEETVLHVIAQTSAHAAEHLGQIMYIAKLQLGPAWKSLNK